MLHNSATQTSSTTVTGKPILVLELPYVRSILLLVVAAAVLAQLLFFFSIDNLIASAVLLCGAVVGFYYSLNRQLLDDYPVSTMMIIGYSVCHFVVPPIGKLVDFQGIVHGLNHPILVWVYGLVGLFALVVAHYFYRALSPCLGLRLLITRGFYRRLHFFEMPDQVQFWLMGIIGIGATLLVLRHSNETGGSASSALARVIVPLIYIPYFASFPTLLDPRYETPRRPLRLALIIYTVLLLAVSAMLNSRGFMLMGFASLACLYGYRISTGTASAPKVSLKTFIIVAVAGLLVLGPIANLAASMLVARRSRGTISAPELAKKTWDIYRSGTATQIYQMSLNRARDLGLYNEGYYNSIFLNRFGNMRFTDLSIDAADKVRAKGRTSYFRKIEYEKVVAVLPAPLINLLHLDINKKEALSGSSEDFLFDLATGGGVGGFKTGELLVIMQVTFGMTWPLWLALILIPFFVVSDASCDLGSLWDGNGGRFDCVVFNGLIAGTIFNSVFYLGATQDTASYVAICTRDWVSAGILYAVVFMSTKWISSFMMGGVLRQQGTIH